MGFSFAVASLQVRIYKYGVGLLSNRQMCEWLEDHEVAVLRLGLNTQHSSIKFS